MNQTKKNIKDIINDYENLYQKKLSLDKLNDLLNNVKEQMRTLDLEISTLKDKITQLQNKFNELNKLSKKVFHPIKTNKDLKELLEKLDNLNIKLKEKLENHELLKNKQTELTEKIDDLKSKVDLLPECISENENGLIIINNQEIKNIKNIKFDENPDEIMVHVTNFYPNNKTILSDYDGNKFGHQNKSYKGVTKECESLIHRHTVHVTINNVVQSTGDGLGSWEQPKYVVIDPLYLHNDELKSKNPSDSWTYGSIKLSEQAILLVNKNYINNLPKEAFNDYKVIVYSGNYEECVQNLCLSLTGRLYNTDPNYAGHYHSDEYASEETLNNRNLLINYIRDNDYKGKEKINLSEQEIKELYELMLENKAQRNIEGLGGIYSNKDNYNVDENILYFYYMFGFSKNPDGTFSIKNDDEVYNLLCNPENINLDELKQINQILTTNLKENNINSSDDIEKELPQYTIADLYKFKNHKYAEAFFKKEKEIFDPINSCIGNFTLTKDKNLSFELYLDQNINPLDIVGNNFAIHEKEFGFEGDTHKLYEIKSNRNMSVEEMLTLLNQIKLKCIEQQTSLEINDDINRSM